jgi:hypothetical protein
MIAIENLMLRFPDPALDSHIIIPKGLKVKTTLKNIAKHAIMNTPSYHLRRRTYCTQMMERLLALMQSNIGYLAPRLPQLLAATMIAKDEILNYFQHLPPPKLKLRKDCKKYYDRFVGLDDSVSCDDEDEDDNDDEYTNLCLISLLPALSIHHILLAFHLPSPSFTMPSLYTLM